MVEFGAYRFLGRKSETTVIYGEIMMIFKIHGKVFITFQHGLVIIKIVYHHFMDQDIGMIQIWYERFLIFDF